MKRTKVFAHRGNSSVAPENSLAAFRSAIGLGVDGIELDVHLSKDGALVVLHDETLERTTTGTGWVKDRTLPELRRLDCGSWHRPPFEDERIPLLGEVLELAREAGICVNVELKNNIIPYAGMEAKTVQEIERFGMETQVILSSFNHHSLKELRKLRPGWQYAALYEFGLDDPWVYARHLGVSAIHPDYRAVTKDMVIACQREGIAVRPYTVDEEEAMAWLLEAEVEAIITNVPERLMRMRVTEELLP